MSISSSHVNRSVTGSSKFATDHIVETHLLHWLDGARRPLVLGLCGAQGSGKSTLAHHLVRRLNARGIPAANLSIDDLYLSHTARARLAETIHPLLATRGVPGTHNVGLGLKILSALKDRHSVCLPRFDKASDDPAPKNTWPEVGLLDVLIFEGWCVGAVAQESAALDEPVNALETEHDADGIWRAYVNTQLEGPYAKLFERLDRLVLLEAPGFEVVQAWRTQQEHSLASLVRRQGLKGARVMTDKEVARFIQHYERLTRHILCEMPARADLTLRLDAQRNCLTSS